MEIEFVNHASVILEHGIVRLLCDLWLDGTAFNEGWALLSPTVHQPSSFRNLTHIWFSHEHPDHFSPRSLERIPEEARPGIEVLFHQSHDRKIIRHCEAMGFRVRELAPGERVALGPDFTVRCSRWDRSDDSWLLVEAGGQRVLDLNDCLVNTPEQMAALRDDVGPVDVLLTQFSISAWDGNPEDEARRQAGARTMLRRAVEQCAVLAPRWLVPFASFVWFCHEENDYMNSAVVTVDEAARAVEQETETKPVVLYPGDRWEPGAAWDGEASLARYREDYASLATRERVPTRTTEFEALQGLAERFRARVNSDTGRLRLRLRLARMNATYQRCRRPGLGGRIRGALALALLRPRPARVWLSDLRRSATFDLRYGLRPATRPRERCDVALTSDSLAYAFRFLWGGLTLQVNGRFQELHPEGRRPLFDALWIADGLNRAAGAEARPL